MKYPFEKVSILELMRHPFDEETGDVHTRMSIRVLSLIFFPFYVVMQVIIPLYFFSTFYNDKEWSLALAIVGGEVTALVVWAGYIVCCHYQILHIFILGKTSTGNLWASSPMANQEGKS